MTTPSGDARNLSDRASFRHWTPITLRYSDQDPMGHVNNATYLVYFEAARVTYLNQFLEPGEGVDTVLARVTVDFLREMHFPGTIEVGSCLLGLGNKSVRSGYGVFRDGECIATSEAVNVFFDTAARRSVLPPEHVRAALEAELTATG